MEEEEIYELAKKIIISIDKTKTYYDALEVCVSILKGEEPDEKNFEK